MSADTDFNLLAMAGTARWHQMHAEQGNADAQYALGRCYANGQGLTRDLVRAATWYHLAARQGHSKAQYAMGRCYANGQGLTRDLVRAATWYYLAARQGHSKAQYALGIICQRKAGCLGKAGWGNNDHPDDLGDDADEDDLIGLNPKNATEEHLIIDLQRKCIACYGATSAAEHVIVEGTQKQASQGEAFYQYKLGHYYAEGFGLLKQDMAMAAAWYQKAAEQGHVDAQHALALCYADGQGRNQDCAVAIVWFRKAAEQGHAEAQYALGRCYMSGLGIGQNLDMAIMWVRKAAHQNHARAQSWLTHAASTPSVSDYPRVGDGNYRSAVTP